MESTDIWQEFMEVLNVFILLRAFHIKFTINVFSAHGKTNNKASDTVQNSIYAFNICMIGLGMQRYGPFTK